MLQTIVLGAPASIAPDSTLAGCAIPGSMPKSQVVSSDLQTGITGVKWQTAGAFTCGVFVVTAPKGAMMTTVSYATKTAGAVTGTITGPCCNAAK